MWPTFSQLDVEPMLETQDTARAVSRTKRDKRNDSPNKQTERQPNNSACEGWGGLARVSAPDHPKATGQPEESTRRRALEARAYTLGRVPDDRLDVLRVLGQHRQHVVLVVIVGYVRKERRQKKEEKNHARHK